MSGTERQKVLLYKESLFHYVCRQGYHQRLPMIMLNLKENLQVWEYHINVVKV